MVLPAGMLGRASSSSSGAGRYVLVVRSWRLDMYSSWQKWLPISMGPCYVESIREEKATFAREKEMAATRTVPDEVVRPGRAIQRVNVYDTDGNFIHQVTLRGTEDEVRAYAATLVPTQ